MKPKMLFVDDRTKRLKYAITELSKDYDVTIAVCVPEALRLLVGNDFDVVSLDIDLDGHDFGDLNSPTCGMELVRYITRTSWPSQRREPKFIVHSTNLFGAKVMESCLRDAGCDVKVAPFGWKQYQHGVIAGAFDVIHPGYVEMFEDAKRICHKLTILMHDKPNQVFSLNDRIAVIKAVRYVDNVTVYKTEEELTALFAELKPDVRIVGDDHEGKTSRPDLPFPTVCHKRTSDWSATKFKTMIRESK